MESSSVLGHHVCKSVLVYSEQEYINGYTCRDTADACKHTLTHTLASSKYN